MVHVVVCIGMGSGVLVCSRINRALRREEIARLSIETSRVRDFIFEPIGCTRALITTVQVLGLLFQ